VWVDGEREDLAIIGEKGFGGLQDSIEYGDIGEFAVNQPRNEVRHGRERIGMTTDRQTSGNELRQSDVVLAFEQGRRRRKGQHETPELKASVLEGRAKVGRRRLREALRNQGRAPHLGGGIGRPYGRFTQRLSFF
jgi:hypothetical protein